MKVPVPLTNNGKRITFMGAMIPLRVHFLSPNGPSHCLTQAKRRITIR